MWMFDLFFEAYLPLAALSLPFWIWMIVMLVLRHRTSEELVQRRKNFKVLAIVAGVIAGVILTAITVFCIMLTIAIAHM